jgi:prevent-host-death family protein
MRPAVRVSATQFKQHVGKYLDATRAGRVIIERQARPTAVLMSVEEYETLDPDAGKDLDLLSAEFDDLVSRMQRRRFHGAMTKAFAASGSALGAAHGRGAKRRGG